MVAFISLLCPLVERMGDRLKSGSGLTTGAVHVYGVGAGHQAATPEISAMRARTSDSA